MLQHRHAADQRLLHVTSYPKAGFLYAEIAIHILASTWHTLQRIKDYMLAVGFTVRASVAACMSSTLGPVAPSLDIETSHTVDRTSPPPQARRQPLRCTLHHARPHSCGHAYVEACARHPTTHMCCVLCCRSQHSMPAVASPWRRLCPGHAQRSPWRAVGGVRGGAWPGDSLRDDRVS